LLQFSELYNISQGIFLAFKHNAKKRQLSVKHSEKAMNRFKYSIPSRFETYTKENFILTCLYICFKKSPSSYDSFLEVLKEIDFNKDVYKFKDSIINYKGYLNSNINYIRENYGAGNTNTLFKEYMKNNIQFYTLWFYLKYKNVDLDLLSNIQSIHINKIKVFLLYVTFSESSLLNIQQLFNESSLLND
jgi:hypothetical protein